MTLPTLGDADTRYLEQIAKDCEQLLGTGMEIEPLELEADGGIVLRLRYRLEGAAGVSEGRGPDLLAAHTDLRMRLVEDRIAVALRALAFG